MPVDKQMRRDYLEEFPDDELEVHLSGEVWRKVRSAWGYRYPPLGSEVVHHIWRGGVGLKVDIPSLLITVSPAAHDYVHKAPKHGVVACVYTKMKKGEYDNEEVRQATGRNLLATILSWRDNQEVVHPYYTELISEIENGLLHDNDVTPT